MTRESVSEGKGNDVSDQDFFFDEEPAKNKPAAGKPAQPARQKASTPAKAASAPAPATTPLFEQNVTMAIAAMIGVIGLLVGVIIGFLAAGGASAGGAAQTPAVTAPAATGAAPALTPEQQTGPLPAGHPAIPGAGASGTPAATATK